MLLKNKTAVIYGAGGSLGSETARAFAKEGAYVFVTGYKPEPVQKIAREIITEGGAAEAVLVDALDEEDVNRFVERVVKEIGRVDLSFNFIHLQDIQGKLLVDLSFEDFTRPIRRAAESHFITGKAAGKAMMKQGSGVILSLTATPGGIACPTTGGFGPACRLIENISLLFATELGPYGVRAVNIRSAGSPDSKVFRDAIDQGGEYAMEFIKKLEDDTMLKRLPLMRDIINTAVFLASDGAAGITGVTVDVTCGTTTAINYKAPGIAFVGMK